MCLLKVGRRSTVLDIVHINEADRRAMTRPMPVRLMGYVAAAALIACTPMSLPAQTGSPSVARVPAPARDSPSDAGPLATHLSSQLTRRNLAKAMKLVGDSQLHPPPAGGQNERTIAAPHVR